MVRIAGSGSRSSLRELRRAARDAHVGGRDREHRLAGELDGLVREDRIVVLDRADVVHAGNVGGGDHRDHAGRRAHRGKVEAAQACRARSG